MYYEISHRIRDSHTNKRIGFVIQDVDSKKYIIVSLDQALYLASNQLLIGVDIGKVNGKPAIVSKQKDIRLSEIEEITLEKANSMIESESDVGIKLDKLFLVSVYGIYPITNHMFVQNHKSGHRYHLEYKPNEMRLGYSFVSSEDLDILGKMIKAGTIFFVPCKDMQIAFGRLLKTSNNWLNAGNFCLRLSNDIKKCSISTLDRNISEIIVGKYDPITLKYVWDSKLKCLYRPDLTAGYEVNVKDLSTKVSKIHKIDKVEFRDSVLHKCKINLEYIYKYESYSIPVIDNLNPLEPKETAEIESRLPGRVIDSKLFKLLSSHSFSEVSSRYTGISPKGKKLSKEHNKEIKRKLKGSSSKGILGILNTFKKV